MAGVQDNDLPSNEADAGFYCRIIETLGMKKLVLHG